MTAPHAQFQLLRDTHARPFAAGLGRLALALFRAVMGLARPIPPAALPKRADPIVPGRRALTVVRSASPLRVHFVSALRVEDHSNMKAVPPCATIGAEGINRGSGR